MATVNNHFVLVRGCPRFARFEVPDALTWVELALGPAAELGGNRVAVSIAGGGMVCHAATPGSSVGGDYGTVPDGQWLALDFDPAQRPRLMVAVETAGSVVELHLTRRETCGCVR